MVHQTLQIDQMHRVILIPSLQNLRHTRIYSKQRTRNLASIFHEFVPVFQCNRANVQSLGGQTFLPRCSLRPFQRIAQHKIDDSLLNSHRVVVVDFIETCDNDWLQNVRYFGGQLTLDALHPARIHRCNMNGINAVLDVVVISQCLSLFQARKLIAAVFGVAHTLIAGGHDERDELLAELLSAPFDVRVARTRLCQVRIPIMIQKLDQLVEPTYSSARPSSLPSA